MQRKLFTMLAAVSLLLSAAVVGLWVRSYWKRDMYTSYAPRLYRCVASNRGVLVMYDRRPQIGPVSDAEASSDEFPIRSLRTYDTWPPETFFGPPRSFLDRVGFGIWNDEPSYVGVTFPHWSLAVALLVPPAAWYARRRRHRVGHCHRCGYDLRATPDRCPECGASPEAAPRTAA
jgi:hypothetical protein